MIISTIAAVSKHDRAIGKKGAIPWHIPEDMKRFKDLTTGHPVIMGKKTWESLPSKFRPLPERTNIVMCNDGKISAPGASIVETFSGALEIAKNSPGSDEVFIIGGGQIYALTLPHVQRLYLTLIDRKIEGADAFFPEYEKDSKLVSEEKHDGFSFQVLDRK